MATTSNIVKNNIDEPLDLRSKSLYARLKRLFSNDVVVRNVGGKKLKIKDTSQVQYATDRNTLRDRFNRVRTSGYSQYSRDFTMAYAASRIELFRDYDTMDMDPIISAALDIYAEECLSCNELGRVLTIRSPDDNIKNILQNLFTDIINVDFNLWSWVRNMCKYGDFYLKLHISPTYGVYLVEPLSSYNVQRIENSNPDNKNYTKFQVSFETGVMEELESYQVAHFRMLSDSNFLPYGKSIIEGARRVWKQLCLLEDAMLIHRIIRAPERRIFKIDVGNIPPTEVDAYIEKLISKTKKVPYVDEKTGDYNLRFNIQNMLEDFYIPVRGSDSGTSIENLQGMDFSGIDDIEYVRNKMLAALKIPKAFLSFEEDLSGKATLASEDVRFAKTIVRIQKIIVSELSKIAMIHLYSQGYTDESLVNFSLELTNPSTIFEKEKIDIWSNKMGVVKDMIETKTFDMDWIYKNVFTLTDNDIKEVKSKIVEDAKRQWRLKQIEEEGNDPALSLQKVNKNGELSDTEETGGAGGEESSGGGSEELPGEMPEESPTETPGGEPPTGGEGGGPPLKEGNTDKKRDQTGEKDASKYPFGEDPLGNLENNEKHRRNPIRKPVLGFAEQRDFSSLAKFLKSNVKKELIAETKQESGSNNIKSMLDEENIREE